MDEVHLTIFFGYAFFLKRRLFCKLLSRQLRNMSANPPVDKWNDPSNPQPDLELEAILTTDKPYGVDGFNCSIYCKDQYGDIAEYPIDSWVNGLITADPSKVQHPNSYTELVDVSNLKLQGLYCDHLGLQDYCDVLAVRRITLSAIPNRRIFKITTYGADQFLLDGTRFATRWDNIIMGIPIWNDDILPLGAPCCTALRSFSHTLNNIVETRSYLYVNYPVPRVVTVNWGEISLSINDANLFAEVVQNYPDYFDTSDYNVLIFISNLDVRFDVLSLKTDWTSQFPRQYLYYVDTAKGNWVESRSFIYGTIPYNTFSLSSANPTAKKSLPEPIPIEEPQKVAEKLQATKPEDLKDPQEVYKMAAKKEE